MYLEENVALSKYLCMSRLNTQNNQICEIYIISKNCFDFRRHRIFEKSVFVKNENLSHTDLGLARVIDDIGIEILRAVEIDEGL